MPTRAEREAFKAFDRYVQDALPRLDGCVPVAMIFMPVDSVHADGAIDIDKEGQARIIWPADFPIEDRGPLLARLAAPYGTGDVVR